MPGNDPVGPPARLPLGFELDGESFELPALDTRTVLDALALEPIGCWFSLIPGALEATQADRIWHRLLEPSDGFDLDDLEHVATSVLSAALGVEFWAATRMAGAVYGNWFAFDGWCFTRGMSPLAESAGRVLAASYTWRAQLCDKQIEVTKLNHEIWSGPPALTAAGRARRELPSWATDGREEDQFAQLTHLFGARRAS